jgi:predicted acetyltransferase
VAASFGFCFLSPAPLRDDDLLLELRETRPGDPARGRVPSYVFGMRRDGFAGDVGQVDLRVGDSEFLKLYLGHVGYSVDPSHRGRNFAARSVQLVLPLARQHGMRELWITCDPANRASKRTCEKLGAEFIEVVNIPVDSYMYRRGERQKCRYLLRIDGNGAGDRRLGY